MKLASWLVGCALGMGAFAMSAVTLDPPHAAPTTAPAPAPLRVTSVDGVSYLLSDDQGVCATGIVFVGTQCPISNKYIPDLNHLADALRVKHGDTARLFLAISDPDVTRAAAAKYVADFKISFPVIFDASGELARTLKPSVTPEAYVLDKQGAVQYRGRIDDSWVTLAKQKPTEPRHDLAEAIDAVVAGKAPAEARTASKGCVFEAWDSRPKDAAITYARDIAPIFNADCVQCHRDGEVAPFSLTAYESAAKHAKQIAQVTGDRLMPPWKAEPGYGHFLDERRLSEDQIALINRWASGGAPKGDDADLPPSPKFTGAWTLGEPDAVVSMSDPFPVPAAGHDVYRVFPIAVNIPEDKFVVGFEFKPGASTVVHHALLFLDDKGRARQKVAENTDGLPGYRSFGGLGFTPSGGLGGWAPGAMPYLQPDGVGRPMHKGTDVILQVHYHPDGKEHRDKSQLALYFAKKPIRQVSISIPLANNRIDIQPGDAHYVRTASITAPRDVTLLGIVPHMHLVGRQMKVKAVKPDGTEVPLIWVKDWDFRWQDQYRFAEPVKLPKGTVVSLEAIYDNSSANADNPNVPPQRVRKGEQTTDEMCLCFLQLTVDNWFLGTPGSGNAKLEILKWFLESNRGTTQPIAKE